MVVVNVTVDCFERGQGWSDDREPSVRTEPVKQVETIIRVPARQGGASRALQVGGVKDEDVECTRGMTDGDR